MFLCKSFILSYLNIHTHIFYSLISFFYIRSDNKKQQSLSDIIKKMQIQQPKEFSKLDQFTILKQLGSGTEANVKLAEDPNGTKVAIKKYKLERFNLEALQKEVKIIKNFDHQNIIKLIGCRPQATYTKKDGTTYSCSVIIFEYVGGGQLFDYIADSGRFSQNVTRSYFGQLMNGLHHMHEKGYVHRDLKPQNLLLSELFELKIGDFGFATLKFRNNGVLNSRLGTHGYMAPEIYEHKYNGEKTDIFAAGVILFIMYSGFSPFEKATKHNPFYLAVIKKDYARFWGYFEKKKGKEFFNPKFKDLIEKMIAFDPAERLQIVQIAQHPWIQGEIPKYPELKAEFDKRKQMVAHAIEKRKQEEEKKKQQVKKQMDEGWENKRVSKSYSEDDKFVEDVRVQAHLNRKVPLIEDLESDDLLLSEELSYVIVKLKTFLVGLQLNIHNNPFQEKEHVPLLSRQELLHLQKLQDSNQHEILAQLQCENSYGEGEEEDFIVEKLILKFTFGKTHEGKIVLRCEREEGDWFYGKRVIGEVRKLFA